LKASPWPQSKTPKVIKITSPGAAGAQALKGRQGAERPGRWDR
jgi:hypothetical protein